MLAQKIFESIEDHVSSGTTIYNAGLIYTIDENYDEAIFCFQKALSRISEKDDLFSVINIYNNMGDAYRMKKDYANAEKYLNLCLSMSRKAKYFSCETAALANLAEVKMNMADYDRAEFFCNEVLSQKEQLNKNALVVAHLNLGRIFFARSELEKAEQELNEAFHLAKSIESKDHLSSVLMALVHLYEKIGDYRKAFYNLSNYQSLKDDLHDSKIDRKLAEVKFQHDLENKQREAEIERLRNVELKQEKERSDNLLRNILPDEVAEELKASGKAAARLFDNVTVLFTDFKGFTKVSERLTPQQLVDELHECFRAFDGIVGKYNIEKIKTVGDAYMAACGLPNANPNHAEDMIKAAMEIRDFMKNRQLETRNPQLETFEIRIGLNSGSVVAGIVGVKKFAYDIWGDTVNTAARMEQNGEAGKINISEATYQLVKHNDNFSFEYRGEIEAKNKGKLRMYFVS